MELDALYQEYAKLLYHFIYLKCHDRALAEDIVQSTFLKAILQIDSFQGKSKISTWLCEIARNEYLNYCRKHERQQSCDEYVQKSGERPLKQEGFFRDAVLESMIVKEQADMIKRVVHTLKEPYKEVFLLRVYGECSFGEIAELFQKSDTWARVTYYRAKTKIIEEFEEKGGSYEMYDILLDGYGLQDEESSVVRLAYTDRNAYASDMKKAVMEKYRRYFDGKELKYKGLEEIGYQETAKMGNARTLSAVLKFEGKDRIEYYLVLYKTLNGRYLAEDYFGDPYLSYTSYRESKEMDGGKAAKAENGNGGAYHTDDTLFSCLPNRLSDLDMVLMRQMTLLSGQRALQGDKALAKAGQMRLPLISVQDLENGTHKLQESANAELAKLSGSGYYVTDLTWSVKEYDREKYLYRYRINMELTHETSLEKKIVTFDCYRIGDQFLYMEGTEEVYQ